jgi:hypothetical protein
MAESINSSAGELDKSPFDFRNLSYSSAALKNETMRTASKVTYTDFRPMMNFASGSTILSPSILTKRKNERKLRA